MTPQEQAQQTANALVKFNNGAVELANVNDALAYAGVLVKSNLCPSFKTPEALVLAFQLARSMDVPLAAVNQYFYVVNGRAAIFGKMIPAIAMRTGELVDYHEGFEGNGDDRMAFCAGKRKFAKTGNEISHRAQFSVADAKRAGLWGKAGPWALYPQDMIMHKARARFFGFLFADALCGLPVKEDVQDIDPERENVRPVRTGAPNRDVLTVHASPLAIPAESAQEVQEEPIPSSATSGGPVTDADIDEHLREP